jgi:hypothetical protein
MGMLTSRWTLLAAGVVAAGVAVLAVAEARDSSGSAPISETAIEQRNDAGGVAVRAIYVTAGHLTSLQSSATVPVDLDRQAAIHLVLDAHQGDLRTFAYAENATVSAAEARASSSRWFVLKDDAHHLEGLLVFDLPSRGDPLRLTLRDLGGVAERTFLWQAPP